MCMHIRLLR